MCADCTYHECESSCTVDLCFNYKCTNSLVKNNKKKCYNKACKYFELYWTNDD